MNNVTGQLWVGDFEDSRTFGGEVLCVYKPPELKFQRMSWCLEIGYDQHKLPEQLDKIADLITDRLAAGRALLVYCGAGVEQSPLACAWWLWKTGRWPSFAHAYDHLKAIRPNVIDRTGWFELGIVGG